MKLAVITNYDLHAMGGAEEYIDRLAMRWHQTGHQVTVFCRKPAPVPPTAPRPWQPEYPIQWIDRPWSTRFGLGKYVRLLKKFHQSSPIDLLLACDSYWPGFVAEQFHRKSHVPYVLCSQGSDIMDGSRFLKRTTTRKRIISALTHASGIACISSYMKARTEQLTTPQGVVRLIPNGWPDEWTSQTAVTPLISQPYLLCLGRMIESKGFQVVLDAYQKALPHTARWGLVLAGQGDYYSELVQRAIASGISVQQGNTWQQMPPPWIWFPSLITGTQKQSIVQHAEVGIIPSLRYEPQGIVTMEMLASSVPVIGSNIGGIPDIVHHEKNGWLFTPGSVKELSETLVKIASNSSIIPHVRENCFKSVKNYRWSMVADQYLAFFEEIWQQKKLFK
ncbi:MAG: glycosyltransferase family 4 protein [Zavarzinella sp.]